MRLICFLFCTVLAVAVWLVTATVPPAGAEVRLGTFAWDFRNRPVAAPLSGYERVMLSPRAFGQPALDTLRAGGAKLIVWTQPVWAMWDGRPVTDFAYDRDLLAMAERYDATLEDSAGRRMTLLGDGPNASYLFDFRRPEVPDALAEIVTRHFAGADGVLLDYGCGSLDWNSPGLGAAEWERWRRGWLAFVAALRERRPDWQIIAQCDRWPKETPGAPALAANGIFLEHCGWELNPAKKVWQTVKRGTPGVNCVRQEDALPKRRRLFAAIALLTDSAFDQCEVATNALGQAYPTHLRNPEHFELDLGKGLGAWRERRAGVYERAFERGFVIANLGTSAFRESRESGQSVTVPPEDALVAQTKDARGAAMPWITNEGR